jgi:serine/threonine protein kinase
LDKTYDPIKADTFSIGCIALELLCSQKFFKERWLSVYILAKQRRETDFLTQIKYAIENSRAELGKIYHPEIRYFISEMLEFYPGIRGTLQAISERPWITDSNVLDAIDKLNGRPCSSTPAFGKLLYSGQVIAYTPPNKKTNSEYFSLPKQSSSEPEISALFKPIDILNDSMSQNALIRLMPNAAAVISQQAVHPHFPSK